MRERIIPTRLEFRVGPRSVAVVQDGEAWETICDGKCLGRYVGPHALHNAIDALPAVLLENPPEHPHGGGA